MFGDLALDASIQILNATITAVHNKFTPSVGDDSQVANPVAGVGDHTVWTPAPGKRIRLKWVGLSTSKNNSGDVVVKWRFGASGAYFWPWIMGAPGAFA